MKHLATILVVMTFGLAGCGSTAIKTVTVHKTAPKPAVHVVVPHKTGSRPAPKAVAPVTEGNYCQRHPTVKIGLCTPRVSPAQAHANFEREEARSKQEAHEQNQRRGESLAEEREIKYRQCVREEVQEEHERCEAFK